MELRSALSGLGVRFERSAIGECLISVAVVIVVAVGVVWNLPDSHLRRTLVQVLRPVAESTGLQQRWSLYAPNPVSAVETLEVRVTMVDGQRRTWTLRGDDPGGTSLRWYHWQKLKEQVIRRDEAVPDFVRWAIRRVSAPNERPARAEVLVRSQPLRAPGDDRPTTATTRTIYRVDLRASR